MLTVIRNHLGKHVNRTSQIEIVMYKKILCSLKRIKLLSKKKDVVSTFNKHLKICHSAKYKNNKE